MPTSGVPGSWRRRRGVGVLVAVDSIPASVEDDHVVELQALGSVRCQQQQPVLAARDVAGPLGQPFDEG